MNRIFNLVWSRARDPQVVTDEQAQRRGKAGGGAAKTEPARAGRHAMFCQSMRTAVLTPALLTLTLAAPATALAQALPTGGQVVAGSGVIGSPGGGTLAIDQASQSMSIDWQQFNIGAANTVRFNQPGADAVALNRVLGPDASQIMGRLQANGRVFLVNPNGVLFGQGAQVDVGALVASTLNISNTDFMAGNYRFLADSASTEGALDAAQDQPASVVNRGRITAADGGAVALLGGQVHNHGVIQARMGTVALAAGNAFTLDFAGDGLLNVQIDQAAKNALVDNGHLIQADGGQVLMTAHASDALLQTVVNNTGVIEARTLENREGKIVLLGDFSGGTVKVDGKLDASAPDGGDGGFIDTSGAYVQVADDVMVTTFAPQGKTGTWLIDPTDFTIWEGNDSQTESGIGAATLSGILNDSSGGSTNVELVTVESGDDAGDIYVEAAVSWTSSNTLTLIAHNDININAEITASGSDAGLSLFAGRNINIGAALSMIGDDGFIFASAAGALTVENLARLTTNGSISLQGDDAVVVNADLLVNEGGTISLFGGDIAVNADVTANGDGGYITMSACGGCGNGDIDIDGAVSVDGNGGIIAMMADGTISVRDAVSVHGNNGQILMFGGDVSIQSGGSLDVQGSDGEIMLAACGDPSCGAGSIEIDGAVSVNGDDGTVMMMADGAISIRDSVLVTGEGARIGLLGQDITVQTDGSLRVEGGEGVIALAACGDCGALDIADVTPDSHLDPSFGLSMDGVVLIDGDVSIDGDKGIIAISGGFIQVDSQLAIKGDEGVIALAACTDDGCGDILINDEVSIKGDDSTIFMMADDGLWVSGDVSIKGNNGNIALLGGELTIGDGSAVNITGDGGKIGASVAEDLVSNGALSVTGNHGNISLSGSTVLVNNTVTVTGDAGSIEIGACGCDAEGYLAISGDVAVNGKDGTIDLSSEGSLLLDANLTATAVFMQAGDDIAAVEGSVITADQLDVRSDDGAIALDQGAHRVGMMQASARTGLWFANATDLALGQARVTGNGDIAIRTAGDLTLVEAFDPLGAPLPTSGTVRVHGSGDIDLVAGQAFTNTLGADALQVGQGDWRIWSSTPAGDTLAGLAYDFKQYNAHYGSSAIMGQGNGVLYTLAPVLDIGLKGATSKTYDGTDLAVLTDSNYELKGGLQAGDGVEFSKPSEGRYSDSNAGEGKTVTVDGLQLVNAYEIVGGAKVYGYRVNGDTASGDIGRIDRRSITVAADDQRKRLGQADPALTWRIVDGSLAFDDALNGALVRDSGELPGSYTIWQGSLDAGGNYTMNFIGGELVIAMADIDDDLGDLAEAYRAAVFSAKNTPQGPMAFDRETEGGPAPGGSQPSSLYNIENEGLRMPDGI